MTSDSSRTSRSRMTISLPALLCAVLGTALLFGRHAAQQILADYWSSALTFAWLLTSSLLIFWGLSQLFQRATETGRTSLLTRHRVAVPRPGLVYIVMMVVMLSGSLLGKSNMLMLMFAMMAGPFVLNGWITYSMLRGVRVRRSVPRTVMAGEPCAVDLTLENRKIIMTSWVMTVQDQLTNGRERLAPDVLFFRVPRRGSRHAAYQVRLMHRGRYELGPLTARTRFPLGLVERSVIMPNTDQILVFPRLGKLSQRWRRDHLLAAEFTQNLKPQRGVFDDEFHSIREFRSGDNPKSIHWRTSARQNQLMVREYHQSRDRNLLLLLDLYSPDAATDGQRQNVELAISFAATVCIEQMRSSRDARIELGLAAKQFQHWEGRSGPAAADTLLEMLALTKATPHPELRKLHDLAIGRATSVTRTILITTRRDLRSPAALAKAWSLSENALGEIDVRVVLAEPEFLKDVFAL